MYYYGMVEVAVLHENFMRVTKRVISYGEFLTFVKCRCSLWAFGVLLRDVQRQKDYYQCVNVENPEMLLMYIQQHNDLSYKNIEKKTYFTSARRRESITAGREFLSWVPLCWMKCI